MGPSWAQLKSAVLGPWPALGTLLGALGAVMGPFWAPLGAILDRLGAALGPREPIGGENARRHTIL
eukprot:9398771-Pyramimonas_sp.AAC.1